MTYWDSLSADQYEHEMCHVPVADCLSELAPILKLRPLKRILDLGSGIGRLTFAVCEASPHAHVIGVDHSHAMHLESSCRQLVFPYHDRITFLQNDGQNIPDEVGVIDAAFSIGVFQHMTNPFMRNYIQQVASHLRPGGLFIFQFVHSGEEGPLSYNRGAYSIVKWCREIGFRVKDFHLTPDPAWCWVTVGKR